MPSNGRDPLMFFDEADKNFSPLCSHKSTLDDVAMLMSRLPYKGSPPDKLPTLIYKKIVIS